MCDALDMSAVERAAERVERGRRLQVMLDLLTDAGADDLVATLTAEQAEHLYHSVVHAVGRAAGDWRLSRGPRGGGNGEDAEP